MREVCSDGTQQGAPVCSRENNGQCGWVFPACPPALPADAHACPQVLVACDIACPAGFANGGDGCPICQCKPIADGGSCQQDSDCGNEGLCGFPVADQCAAVGTCFPSPGVRCEVYLPGCACGDREINTACTGLPEGYESAPLLHAGACVDAGQGSGG